MNHIKNKLLVVLTLTTVTSTFPNGSFGGGLATGAILGTGLTLAATSGNRTPQDPNIKQANHLNRELNEEEKNLNNYQTQLEREKAKNNPSTKRINSLKSKIKLSEKRIDRLNDQLDRL